MKNRRFRCPLGGSTGLDLVGSGRTSDWQNSLAFTPVLCVYICVRVCAYVTGVILSHTDQLHMPSNAYLNSLLMIDV